MALTKLVLGWTWQNGHQGSNTLYWESAAAPTNAELTSMANAVYTAWNASDYRTYLTNDIQLRQVTAQGGAIIANPGTGTPFIFDPTTDAFLDTNDPTSGTNVDDGQQVPPQVAAVVSLRTGVAGRRNRGRIYLPGPAVGHITEAGNFGGDFATATVDFVTDMDTQLDLVEAGNFAVVSLVGGTAADVTTYQSSIRTETQRRRTKP